VIATRAADLFQRVAALTLREWLIAVVVTALVIALTWLAVTGARAVRATDAAVRKIHQQQANIIGMMLKAGFRPVSSKDWFDDGDRTREIGDPALTQFDWRKPGP
jgi:hypothetical protein